MSNKVTPHPRLQEGQRALTRHKAGNARVFAISSGKGGVGKTNVTTNLAISLARRGHRVCVFDADTGLANINILLGFTPEHTLEHLINGHSSIEDVIQELPEGIAVIPGASGIAECVELTGKQQRRLLDAIRRLEKQFDYILIDTSAGIGRNVVDFFCAVPFPVLVISPEPTSLTDAYSLLRVGLRNGLEQQVHVLVNSAPDFRRSREIFARFRDAVEKYLHTRVRYLGYIANDANVPAAVRLQCPVVLMKPDTPASRCYRLLAEYIDGKLKDKSASPEFSQYWENRSDDLREDEPRAASSPTLRLDEIGDAFHTCLGEESVSQPAARAAILNLLKIYSERFNEPVYDPLPELLIALNSGRYDNDQLAPLAELLLQHYPELTGSESPRPDAIGADSQAPSVPQSEDDDEELYQGLRLASEAILEQQGYLQDSLIRLAEKLQQQEKSVASPGGGNNPAD